MTKKKSWNKALAEQWNKWTPPDRPSPGEMRVHEEYLKKILAKNKKPNVMVLGSTSEFRDLFAKYKLPCTVVEYKKENYSNLGMLMKREPTKETLLEADWRIVKPQEKYDLVLGDFCINVLPKKDQTKFIQNISRLLKPTGFCLLKTFVRYDAERGDLAASLEFYRTKKKHRPILETIMAPMFKYAYNFKKDEGKLSDVWLNFVNLYKKKKLEKEEFAYFASLKLKEVPLKVYIPLLSDILEVIDKNAHLSGLRFGGEWFSQDVPIIIFKKN